MRQPPGLRPHEFILVMPVIIFDFFIGRPGFVADFNSDKPFQELLFLQPLPVLLIGEARIFQSGLELFLPPNPFNRLFSFGENDFPVDLHPIFDGLLIKELFFDHFFKGLEPVFFPFLGRKPTVKDTGRHDLIQRLLKIGLCQNRAVDLGNRF